uniref:TNFR-Cys domain-containing protein n=1 Tax=Oncorhynchus tshawytscha TaxID=74940 RepID=A0A8C8M4Z8_ONCTS
LTLDVLYQKMDLYLKSVNDVLGQVHGTAVENRECREQEYRDEAGDCIACRQCGSGQELSTECGFGYGAGARCAPCRPGRYKEEAGGQKCKPCLSCAHTSRLHRANCTTTGNAVCGDCLPGRGEQAVARVVIVLDDMFCLPFAPCDALCRLHYPLESLAVVGGAVAIPSGDTARQDALNCAPVKVSECFW